MVTRSVLQVLCRNRVPSLALRKFPSSPKVFPLAYSTQATLPAEELLKPKTLNYGLDHAFTQTYMQGLKKSQSRNYSAALIDYQKALDISLSDGGTRCLEHATVLLDMAKVHVQMGSVNLGVDIARKALPVYKEYWGSNHQTYAEAAFDLACYLALLKKGEEALDLLHDCRTVYLRNFGPEHKKTAQVLQMILFLERKSSK